jgi:hypothetical protein
VAGHGFHFHGGGVLVMSIQGGTKKGRNLHMMDLQKYMKSDCVHYILCKGMVCASLYKTTLSIVVVSAIGSYNFK